MVYLALPKVLSVFITILEQIATGSSSTQSRRMPSLLRCLLLFNIHGLEPGLAIFSRKFISLLTMNTLIHCYPVA